MLGIEAAKSAPSPPAAPQDQKGVGKTCGEQTNPWLEVIWKRERERVCLKVLTRFHLGRRNHHDSCLFVLQGGPPVAPVSAVKAHDRMLDVVGECWS